MIQRLLTKCESHSQLLGYRWNPDKCVIILPPKKRKNKNNNSNDMNNEPLQHYYLYDTPIPTQHSFSYLGIPIMYGGIIDKKEMIKNNTTKAINTLGILTSIGFNGGGFSKLTCSRIYQQFIRSQLEYGLAIITFNKYQIKKMEDTQNKCIRQIYSANSRSSTIVMKHLARLPSMHERIEILQMKYLDRVKYQPENSLLNIIITILSTSTPTPSTKDIYKKHSLWNQLKNQSFYDTIIEEQQLIDIKVFIKKYRLNKLLDNTQQSSLLQSCKPKIAIDPILYHPMNNKIRSGLICWRIGWLPGGKPKSCICNHHPLTRKHVIQCLNMHARLSINQQITLDPLSYLINRIPINPPISKLTIRRWNRSWPQICNILLEIEQIQYPQHSECNDTSPDLFLNWVNTYNKS
ncbi:unnamed protein product [Cunninghamella echinulata]